MKTTCKGIILIAFLYILGAGSLSGQYTLPEIFDTGTLEEQLEYLKDRTRIYNDFRAIRDDMFLEISKNSLDSLNASKAEIRRLGSIIDTQQDSLRSIETTLDETRVNLDEAIKNRDRLKFIGIPMHKVLYNSIMWVAIAALALLSVILFLSAKRSISNARTYSRELEETREEFEAHRKTSRERYEQLVVKHHNELRKLKGN